MNPTSNPFSRYRLPNHSKVPCMEPISARRSTAPSLRFQLAAVCACGITSTLAAPFSRSSRG